MLKLIDKLADRWDANPRVLRLSRAVNEDRHVGLLAADGLEQSLVFWDENAKPKHVKLPHSMHYLAEGDIVRVVPRAGEIATMYRRSARANAVFVTEQCNSNCVMCSQPPKDVDDHHLIDAYLEAIPLMDPATPELGITGGEATLLGERLLRLIEACRSYLPSTALHMLSNGRLFRYLSLAQAIADIKHPDFMIGVPLYSDIAHHHDHVVQAMGAYDQTLRGILNLKRCGVKVELRVVLHQLTIARLPQLARFIARNLPVVDHVALMGLEMMGYVKMNLGAIWIDPKHYQRELGEAVGELSRAGVRVSIYNHQLCVLDKPLWPFAVKSISDWKNEYLPVCDQCAVKGDCGGFFSSTLKQHSDFIRPVLGDLADAGDDPARASVSESFQQEIR